jgi:two-component system chemotaxis response regulator CheY
LAYRILIVDDAPMMRIVIREMLEMLGQEIVGEADTGEGALEQYTLLKPDLVTLDISLPDKDGITVFRHLQQIDPAVKVVLVTGNDQDKIKEQAEQLGALGLIPKPFRKENLEKIIAKLGGPTNDA